MSVVGFETVATARVTLMGHVEEDGDDDELIQLKVR
jgi:hypothetical protein